MDPVSISLAVVPLAAEFFSGAIKAMSIIRTARDAKDDYRHLTIRLALEQSRLFDWATAIGLVDYINGGRQDASEVHTDLTGVNRSLIEALLEEIKDLVVGFSQQESVFKSELSSDYGASWVGGQGQLKQIEDQEGASNPRIEEFVKKVVRGPLKKLRWAATGKLAYENMLNKLKGLNDGLLNLMSHATQEAIASVTRETNISLLQLHNKIDELKDLMKASWENPINSRPVDARQAAGLSHTDALKPNTSIYGLAVFKAIKMRIESETALDAHLAEQLELVLIPRNRIKFPTQNSPNQPYFEEAFYTSEQGSESKVFVEWKKYEPQNQRTLEANTAATLRIKKLTALLKDENKPAPLLVPKYLGYISDAEANTDYREPKPRFGLVFFIAPTGNRPQIKTLRTLLDDSQPSLTCRMSMARKIASSLATLHAVDWLHKGISPSAIIFRVEKSGMTNLDSPLVCRFGYSRPAAQGEHTDVPDPAQDDWLYRHPDAFDPADPTRGQSFRMSFDIYSFGILLAEILCWKKLVDLLKSLGDKHPLRYSPCSVYTALVETNPGKPKGPSIFNLLASVAGDQSRDAVMLCLNAPDSLVPDGELDTFDETTPRGRYTIAQAFQVQVIRRLEGIVL